MAPDQPYFSSPSFKDGWARKASASAPRPVVKNAIEPLRNFPPDIPRSLDAAPPSRFVARRHHRVAGHQADVVCLPESGQRACAAALLSRTSRPANEISPPAADGRAFSLVRSGGLPGEPVGGSWFDGLPAFAKATARSRRSSHGSLGERRRRQSGLPATVLTPTSSPWMIRTTAKNRVDNQLPVPRWRIGGRRRSARLQTRLTSFADHAANKSPPPGSLGVPHTR